ncbi:ABC transporter permease [Pararhodobacter zhoushanensis]|uniref:MlaE family lipid ABC transporter permease subunit n=1 Tax=Pararhodobacter zhoushanensis TaxID=2479545 RepID=A0ABT3H059_9RHOB|nr:MlaE family lipid ABC transporter permease subunit [Pararhodobacter zhoushanensis]MCW1933168.1 MlaE family lipid ABC transporter permease subunit [Pararhodobacter zhoushanensis]
MTVPPDLAPEITVVAEPASTTVAIRGQVTIYSLSAVQTQLANLPEGPDVSLDLTQVTRLDTAGAWLVTTLREKITARGAGFEVRGLAPEAQSFLDSVEKAMPHPEAASAERKTLADLVAGIGAAVVGGVSLLLSLLGYFGMFLARLARAFRHPREFRLTALVHHCEEVGLKAVPIVALMAFLIGVVLAFQGASQLRQFGAEVFVVDLIAVSILRELGILLTSIIVAGRTASAFTAAIGSMKMREEIDAMRTLGLDPGMTLFVPRILALLLMLPILGLIADIAGLFGGALMAWVELGISPAMFRTRLVEGTDVSHFLAGVIKAPVFALIIGVIGCRSGMQVQSNAESLGQMTSKAVVMAIFSVIVADAAFSIFFAQIGF